VRNIIFGRSESDTCSFGKLQLFFDTLPSCKWAIYRSNDLVNCH